MCLPGQLFISSEQSKIFNEVFTFKRNLFVVFIVKNIDLRVIRVDLFLVRAKNDSLIF